MANPFFLTQNRLKVLAIVCLALLLTKTITLFLTDTEPQNLNWQPNLPLTLNLASLRNWFALSPAYPTATTKRPLPSLFPTRPETFVSLPSSQFPTPTVVSKPITTPFIFPTSTNRQLTVSPLNPNSAPTTNFSKPTKIPKPTKPPQPTPFQLTNPRPGKDFKEIATIVGPIMCVPPAMVYALYENEAGYLGPQALSNWEHYNSYQGTDPTDVPGSQAVFGVTQMMGDTWSRIKPYVAQKLGTDKLSLNVSFDAMAAAAYHVGNISLAWKNKVGCNDWPVSYILYGACRYNGACPADTFGKKEYYNSYTYNVCASYNRFANTQKNCR